MGFTTDESMVRIDFWKPSGKWYATCALHWDRWRTQIDQDGVKDIELIHDTFKRCLHAQFPSNYIGMTVTCLKPYHQNSHPLMMVHEG